MCLYGPVIISSAHEGERPPHFVKWAKQNFPSNTKPKNVEGAMPATCSTSDSSLDSLLQQLMNTNGNLFLL
jgi:hypothetical protein